MGMSAEVIAYVAVSLDGYLAADEGAVDFLERFGTSEYGFHKFFDSIDAVVMGSATYEQILGFGWPYGNTPGLVLTTRELRAPEGPEISYSDEPTGIAIRRYADLYDDRVWVVGGGKVITEGLLQGAIDVLEMYVMPVVLGSGVPLFSSPYDGRLDLANTEAFSNGVVKLVYSTTP
jgi:dihydrofolate reductase